MSRVVDLTAEVTCILPTGRGGRVPPGTYPVVEIDGAAQRDVAYITVGDDLVCIAVHGPATTFREVSDDLTEGEVDEMLRRVFFSADQPTRAELDASFDAAVAAAASPIRDRLEITGIVRTGQATAQLGPDLTDGVIKLGMIVTIAGQEDPVLLLMTEDVTRDMEHLLSTGHLPT